MLFIIVIGILLFWTLLTVWVEFGGTEQRSTIGEESAPFTALVVYNPDPIYDLDRQVCVAFAEGLAGTGFFVNLATVDHARTATSEHDLFVVCANTYNWAPDHRITGWVERSEQLQGKPVVAITLGAGSTGSSKTKLEKLLDERGCVLVGSRQFWLLRPNDDTRTDDNNVEVAVDMARAWGRKVGADHTRKPLIGT